MRGLAGVTGSKPVTGDFRPYRSALRGGILTSATIWIPSCQRIGDLRVHCSHTPNLRTRRGRFSTGIPVLADGGDHLEDAEGFLTVRTAGGLAELSRGQQAKPTAIGIGHDHPADLVLADVDTSRPEGDQTVNFFLLVAVGGRSEVEMQPVLP
jgi:hypothetical protein